MSKSVSFRGGRGRIIARPEFSNKIKSVMKATYHLRFFIQISRNSNDNS